MENTIKTYEEVRNNNFNALCDFINGLNLDQDIDLLSYMDKTDFDETTDFGDLTDELIDGCAFDREIIYYSNAIEYLSEHDCSLTRSLEIAGDYGYKPQDLNSELLASLLASENARNEWYEHQDEIEDFLSELDWEYEEED